MPASPSLSGAPLVYGRTRSRTARPWRPARCRSPDHSHVELGARRAQPGEFTQRAFLNDKLDLAQAEAIADIIDAGSREAVRAAMRSLQGEFSNMVRGLTDAVVDLRTYVEAAIDFPEEEIDFLADRQITERFQTVHEHFDGVEQSARQGRLLREGMTVVIAGRPNAGKSSLLNRLAGYDAAIVTPIPGTTRDIVRERIDIDGMPLHVLDTAGLRQDAGDEVEAEGIRRAHAEMHRADRVLFVIDVIEDPLGHAYHEERQRLPSDVPVTLVFNSVTMLLACRSPTQPPVRHGSRCRPTQAKAFPLSVPTSSYVWATKLSTPALSPPASVTSTPWPAPAATPKKPPVSCASAAPANSSRKSCGGHNRR